MLQKNRDTLDSKKTDSFNEKRLKIELKLFEITIVLTVLIFLFWAIFSHVIGYILPIRVIYTGGLFVYLGLYIAFKKGVSFNIVASVYYTVAYLLLASAWLPAGGISGSIMHYFVLIFISGLLVLPPKAYLALISATVTLVLSYGLYELNSPNAAAQYATDMDRIRDLSITGVIMVTSLGFCFYAFKKAYLADRVKLSKVIDELEIEKERAQLADKAKSQFLATISHEMRTPLNGVVGLTELLTDTDLNREQKELVQSLTYSSKMLHSLIVDVLDLTMIENEKVILEKNESHIHAEVSELIELFEHRTEAKSKKVQLHFNYDNAIPEKVIWDSTRVRQVLINLINNAIKFTREGSVTVNVNLINSTLDSVRIKFSVIDTGIGISEEDQKSLFDKFFRANSGLMIEGTGLGLAISKKLVELMGGTIQAYSTPGKGSTFSFELPFEVFESSLSSKKDEEETSVIFDSLKVLVVDDVLVNQLVLEKMLNHIGITDIEVVSNGKEAVEKALETVYDFIFMDIQMPVMNGIEASEIISKFYTGKSLPRIIAVSADIMNADLENYGKVGILEFISKPLSIDKLEELFSKFH